MNKINNLTRFTIVAITYTSILTVDVYARGDLSSQQPIEVKVFLGNKENPQRFIPSKIEFETGKLYKLKLVNASQSKHYFTSSKFSASIYTRKVQVISDKGKTIAEVKGAIRTIEVYPGQTAEWWFVPIKTGMINDLHCQISGHTEAGMTGKITIK